VSDPGGTALGTYFHRQVVQNLENAWYEFSAGNFGAIVLATSVEFRLWNFIVSKQGKYAAHVFTFI
jgi:hypothetical protein